MANPNDVTIDIPLTKVSSKATTGARKANATSPIITRPTGEFPDPMNEKQNLNTFQRVAGGRRRKIEVQGKGRRDSSDGSLTMAGKVYMKIYHFSIITRYFLFVAPLAIVIAVPLVLGATVFPKATIGGVRMLWFFVWVEVVWVSL